MNHKLSSIVHGNRNPSELTPGLLRSPMLVKASARVLSGFRADELSSAQRKWQAREISNVCHRYSPQKSLEFDTYAVPVYVLEHTQPDIWPYAK